MTVLRFPGTLLKPNHPFPLGHAGLSLTLLFLAGSCTTIERAATPRPALPVPPTIAARYTLPTPVEEAAMAPVGEVHDALFFRGSLRCGGEEIDFHYILPKGEGPSPFVLLLPILGGGEELLWLVAGSLVPHGYAVGWARRAGAPLRPGQDATHLETMFRRTVVHNRALLQWARQQPEVDDRCMFLLGLSTGGIVGGVLAAMEPDLKGVVLALAGGDLSELLAVSSERRAVSWRDFRRRADGVANLELRREIETHLVSDPARFGAYVDPDKVLMVTARYDEVVPPRNQEILWESMGRPEWLKLPLGHYSAILGIGSIMGRVREFFGPRAFQQEEIAREASPVPGVVAQSNAAPVPRGSWKRLAPGRPHGSDAAPSLRPLLPE